MNNLKILLIVITSTREPACASSTMRPTFCYTYVCAYIYIQRERDIHTYIHTDVYIYIYTHMYIHIYVYICIHIHIEREREIERDIISQCALVLLLCTTCYYRFLLSATRPTCFMQTDLPARLAPVTTFGRHLSNATCLIRPHSFCVFFVLSRIVATCNIIHHF